MISPRFVSAALVLLASASLAQAPRSVPSPGAPFSVVEASITDLRTALEQKRTTSREIVQQYLMRIAMYEDRLHAVITVNRNALAII